MKQIDYKLIIFYILIFILLTNVASAQELKVTLDYPTQIRPNRELKINIHVENNLQTTDILIKDIETVGSLTSNDKLKPKNISSRSINRLLKPRNADQTVDDERRFTDKLEIPIPDELVENDSFNTTIRITYQLDGETLAYEEPASVTLRSNPQPDRIISILIDGLRSDTLEQAVAQGFTDNIHNDIFHHGIRFSNCSTIFPSITPAAHTAIYTGAYPHRTGITGFRWFV